MSNAKKVVVRLTADQRQALVGLIHGGIHSAHTLNRARILLKTDADGPDAWTDQRIAQALDIHRMTVARVRRQFAEEGLDATLHKKKPTGRQYRKLDGEQEARLVRLACSEPPPGHARWTLRLLADKLVELHVVDSIHPSTVCRTLKKTISSPGSSNNGSSHRKAMGLSWRRWRT